MVNLLFIHFLLYILKRPNDELLNGPDNENHTKTQAGYFSTLTFHQWLQGDIHVTQIPRTALYHQFRSWWAFAAQGPFLITHNTPLPKDRCPIQHWKRGEALLAKTPVPSATRRSITQAFRVFHTAFTYKKKYNNRTHQNSSLNR